MKTLLIASAVMAVALSVGCALIDSAAKPLHAKEKITLQLYVDRSPYQVSHIKISVLGLGLGGWLQLATTESDAHGMAIVEVPRFARYSIFADEGKPREGRFAHLRLNAEDLPVDRVVRVDMQFGPTSSKEEKPNQSLEPTSTSVTPPAYAGVAPAALVAHL